MSSLLNNNACHKLKRCVNDTSPNSILIQYCSSSNLVMIYVYIIKDLTIFFYFWLLLEQNTRQSFGWITIYTSYSKANCASVVFVLFMQSRLIVILRYFVITCRQLCHLSDPCMDHHFFFLLLYSNFNPATIQPRLGDMGCCRCWGSASCRNGPIDLHSWSKSCLLCVTFKFLYILQFRSWPCISFLFFIVFFDSISLSFIKKVNF